MAVTLTINGVRVSAPENSTILEAARLAGIRIPTLCHHPDLSNVGACRMCVVSVEKARGLQTACTTPVSEGMVVDTESKDARATRRFVLEMLLGDHPNDCMRCEVNGDCELQDLVYEYDVPWPEHGGVHHAYPVDPDPNPFIFIDRNKCILCGRCVRACAEIQNRDVWNLAQRGLFEQARGGRRPVPARRPLRELWSMRGLLPRRRTLRQDERGRRAGGPDHQGADDLRILWRRLQLRSQRPQRQGHTCDQRPGCSRQRHGPVCQGPLRLRLCPSSRPPHPSPGARPVARSWPDGRAQVASGAWRTVAPSPAASPNVAENSEKKRRRRAKATDADDGHVAGHRASGWVEVDWDTALDVVARRFADVKRENGGDALAVLTSAKCTNEENYLANKLARQVMGTNNIDHCARL